MNAKRCETLAHPACSSLTAASELFVVRQLLTASRESFSLFASRRSSRFPGSSVDRVPMTRLPVSALSYSEWHCLSCSLTEQRRRCFRAARSRLSPSNIILSTSLEVTLLTFGPRAIPGLVASFFADCREVRNLTCFVGRRRRRSSSIVVDADFVRLRRRSSVPAPRSRPPTITLLTSGSQSCS